MTINNSLTSSNNSVFTPEDQFKNDLEELQMTLDNLHNNTGFAYNQKVQDMMYSFMQQFARDFNQLPEAERKSPQMDILIRELNETGLVYGDTNGISLPSSSDFNTALEDTVQQGGSGIDWVPQMIDPAIKAAESTL